MVLPSQLITVVYQSIRFLSEASSLLQDIEKMQNPQNNQGLQTKISITSRTLLLGLQAAEMIGLNLEASPQTLQKIKAGEKWCRVVDMPIRAMEEIRSDHSFAVKLEKGFLLPSINVIRAHAEQVIYERDAVQALPEAAREAIPSEKLQNMEIYAFVAGEDLPALRYLETSFRLGATSKSSQTFQRFLGRLRNQQPL